MSSDLSRILNQWPFEPGKLQVRLITGEDGEPLIQMRLDLGVLQMRADGRPDGQRPRGFESLLEYHEARLDDLTQRQGPGTDFVLTSDECRELKEEAAQYYRRYTALWVLKDFEGVVRDTSRNLRTLDILSKHGQAEGDRRELEPFRPYILMMRSRALASQALKDNETKAALLAIDEGLESLRQHYSTLDQDGSYEQSAEVQSLREMRDQLAPKPPPQVSETGELRRRLDEAIKKENYELAAILRDELRSLGEKS